MKTLVVAATLPEVAPLVNHYGLKANQHGVYIGSITDVLITSIGQAAMAFACGRYVEPAKYKLAINAGIGGAFNRDIALGSMINVVSDCFADLGIDDNGQFVNLTQSGLIDGNHFPFSEGWLVNPNPLQLQIPQVKGITVNTVSGSQVIIDKWQTLYNADVESMEGAAFAYACSLQSMPYVQLRAISNYVEPRNRANWQIEQAIGNLNNFLIEFLDSYGN